MPLSYFRKIQPLSPFLLFIVGAFLWAEVLLEPGPVFFHVTENPSPLYQWLQPLFLRFPLVSWISAFFFLYIQAILINYIFSSQGVLDRFSFMASLVYMLLMSSGHGMLFMHPVLFSNLFLLLIIRKVYRFYDTGNTIEEVFSTGMLLALACLFHIQAIVFALLLIMSLFVFYLIDLRSIVATCIGFITPLILYFTILFLFDRLDYPALDLYVGFEWLGDFPGNIPLVVMVLVGFLGATSLLASFHMAFIYLPDKPIRYRKRLWILIYFQLISLATLLFISEFEAYHLANLFIPMSAILSGYLLQMSRKAIPGILLLILLGLIVAGKLAVFF